MSRKVKVVIELDYDVDNLLENVDSDIEVSDEDIISMVEDDVYEDLSDLMRNDSLKYWAEISIINE